MQLELLNEQGQAASKVDAPDTVFGRDYNEALIHQIVVAYQANITAYAASLLAYRCGALLRYEDIWNRQTVSVELKSMLLEWARAVDDGLRRTAAMRMPTEWAKRAECWQALKSLPVQIPSTGIPELHG